MDPLSSDAPAILPLPESLSSFEELTSHFTNTLTVDQSNHMIRAKINLSTYDPKPILDGIRHLKTSV
ncbi:MAG: hypothetical protein ACTHJ4_08440 [Candidatus Nucleicultricaceae bacterium]